MADENIRPLIEDVSRKVDLLVETLGPLPQQVAELREDVRDVKADVAVIKDVVRDHAGRISSLEEQVGG